MVEAVPPTDSHLAIAILKTSIMVDKSPARLSGPTVAHAALWIIPFAWFHDTDIDIPKGR